MTVEEAKKILEKEGFKLEGPGKPRVVSKSFTEYESHKICEAMQTVCSVGYEIKMSFGVIEARKARLRLKFAENINTPGPGEELPKEGNPALKESASQFNDALLDEQAKKIEELTKEKSNLEYQITILNACKEHNENVYRKQIKRLGKKIARLNGIIHDKNAVLSDVAEELRLSKIREKNLVEVSQKYTKENAELKKELKRANNLVEMVRKGSKEYCEYGIAAEKMIQKLAKIIVGKGSVTSEDFEKCRRWAKGYRFNPQLPELSEEEEEKLQHAKKYRVSCDKAEEGGDQSAIIVLCDNGITLSKEEAEIIERCTKNGTELHYSEKDGLTYTNMCGEEIPIICLRVMFHIFTDEEIKNIKK